MTDNKQTRQAMAQIETVERKRAVQALADFFAAEAVRDFELREQLKELRDAQRQQNELLAKLVKAVSGMHDDFKKIAPELAPLVADVRGFLRDAKEDIDQLKRRQTETERKAYVIPKDQRHQRE